jgi:hypothetical protein
MSIGDRIVLWMFRSMAIVLAIIAPFMVISLLWNLTHGVLPLMDVRAQFLITVVVFVGIPLFWIVGKELATPVAKKETRE